MKKKTLFIATCIITLFFSGCKKDPLDIPLGTISVSINGTETTFNIQSKALLTNTAGYYTLTIHGYKKYIGASSTQIKLIITSSNPISAGIFSENPFASQSNVQIDFFQEFILGFGTGYYTYGSPSNLSTVTISSITGTSVKGMFKGELREGSSVGEKKSLSRGVFNVSF